MSKLDDMKAENEDWRLAVDRGDTLDTPIAETTDIEHLFRRIGQMVLSSGIEQVIVYRNGEEYRRYVLERRKRNVSYE